MRLIENVRLNEYVRLGRSHSAIATRTQFEFRLVMPRSNSNPLVDSESTIERQKAMEEMKTIQTTLSMVIHHQNE